MVLLWLLKCFEMVSFLLVLLNQLDYDEEMTFLVAAVVVAYF